MKIVQINTFPYKATGSIMMGIHEMLLENGFDSYVVWGRGRDSENKREIVIKDNIGTKFHGVFTRLTDRTGFASWRATRKLISELEMIKPDIIHLHNIHGYYLNIEMLFTYIKKKNIKVVWTLHDCWSMTGHCAYFDMIGCEKWKAGCKKCEQKNTYPASKVLDSSEWNWEKKRELFNGLNLSIVTPCEWLKSIVQKSYLSEYPVRVIYNGIDINKFRPNYRAEVKRKYSPDNKPLVLGVASEWTERKGLSDFINLSRNNTDIKFVVVGLTQDQLKGLPEGMTGICRTNNVDELIALYSVADVFFNPTYEDNYPTTNLEALACGTPVVTYDTGGSPESIEQAFKICGMRIGTVIKKISPRKVDLRKVIEEIRKMITLNNTPVYSGGGYSVNSVNVNNNNPILDTDNRDSSLRKDCRYVALLYDKGLRFADYLNLYNELLS